MELHTKVLLINLTLADRTGRTSTNKEKLDLTLQPSTYFTSIARGDCLILLPIIAPPLFLLPILKEKIILISQD